MTRRVHSNYDEKRDYGWPAFETWFLVNPGKKESEVIQGYPNTNKLGVTTDLHGNKTGSTCCSERMEMN